ncbi:MAG: PQQ-binding-like beta-propeller repeat protein, partial [Planctomyces sp.]
YCPSPLFYRGRLYMVKNGGILTVLKAETGEVLKQKRLKMTNDYYASPVAGDGKVYLVNVNGGLTVLDADSFEELHTADLSGDVHATPAISDGRLFVRVGDQLYCFGE